MWKGILVSAAQPWPWRRIAVAGALVFAGSLVLAPIDGATDAVLMLALIAGATVVATRMVRRG